MLLRYLVACVPMHMIKVFVKRECKAKVVLIILRTVHTAVKMVTLRIIVLLKRMLWLIIRTNKVEMVCI